MSYDTFVPASVSYAIPLHRPLFAPEDLQALEEALREGLLTGDGPRNSALAAMACTSLGCDAAFPTPSGTHALELAFRCLSLQPGDEVICPSFTFVSVANAVLLAGGTPVFAEVDPETLNLDPEDAKRRLTPRTKAIVTAHYAGIARGLDTLAALTESSGAVLVEDAAHALGGSFLGRSLGTWGIAGAFSFHGTKNLTAGEGGMLVTSDSSLAAQAEVVREKGTDRSRFLRGAVDKYTWQAVGSSYLMSDLLAALVASQWRRLESMRQMRAAHFRAYQQAFHALAAEGLLRTPIVPAECDPAFHIFYLRVANGLTRDRLIASLRGSGIEASSHFVPLHVSPYARQSLGTRVGALPITEQVADSLLRLPLYPQLSAAEQDRVISSVYAFFGRPKP